MSRNSAKLPAKPMEGTERSRNSASALAVGIRAVVRRLLYLWYCLLRFRASTWCHQMAGWQPAEFSRRSEFLKANLKLQEELRQVFNPFYYLCNSECSCCQTQRIPYNFIDGVLYGTPLDLPPGHSPMGLTKLLTTTLREEAVLVRRYFRRYFPGKADCPARDPDHQPQGTLCPALTEKGCGLPWGRRPVLCVFFLCGRFIRVMDWRSYWRYVWVGSRYLFFLTCSLKLVVAEWRSKQVMAA
jgi:hypothetical protein